MEARDELRIDLLAADVGQLLEELRGDLSAGALRDEAANTAERIWAWQLEAALSIAAIANQVRLIRGNSGYQNQAARFSRQQSGRRTGIDQFRSGIVMHSRRLLDRWGWVLTAYLRDVQEFAVTEALRQTNDQRFLSAKETVLDAKTAGLKVIEAQASERLLKVPGVQTLARKSAPIRSYAFDRVVQAKEPINRFVIVSHALEQHRDDLRKSIPSHLTMRDDVRRIPSVISLRQQVVAYKAVLSEEWVNQTNDGRQQLLTDFDLELRAVLPDPRILVKHDLLRSLRSPIKVVQERGAQAADNHSLRSVNIGVNPLPDEVTALRIALLNLLHLALRTRPARS